MCWRTMETRTPICWNSASRSPCSHEPITCKKAGTICGKKGTHLSPRLRNINMTAWITMLWCMLSEGSRRIRMRAWMATVG